MKIPQFFSHKKLSAATARRSSATSAGMDFEEMPEPNMKLSRALLIVLLLHVVAVSGIIAFNAIKTRESSFVPAPLESSENKSPTAGGTAAHSDIAKPRITATEKESVPGEDPKPSHSPSNISSKDDHAKMPLSSGKTYLVKKGDNPVTIARKLKVSYDDLMELNRIEDPRKLRIGQKLLIPKATKPKTTSGKTAKPKAKGDEVRHTKQQAHST